MIPYSAIVLAGGFSERLQADKALADLGGKTLLQHVLDAVDDAQSVTVVGPRRAIAQAVTWCEEEPPGGGPVAAFAAGLKSATSDIVVLLGSDLPFIKPAIPLLLDALDSAAAAVLVDAEGRPNYLASAWRRQHVGMQFTSMGNPFALPMRALLTELHAEMVPDTGAWGFDCDTPEALEIARQRESERNG